VRLGALNENTHKLQRFVQPQSCHTASPVRRPAASSQCTASAPAASHPPLAGASQASNQSWKRHQSAHRETEPGAHRTPRWMQLWLGSRSSIDSLLGLVCRSYTHIPKNGIKHCTVACHWKLLG
jgi:hypothetical protein